MHIRTHTIFILINIEELRGRLGGVDVGELRMYEDLQEKLMKVRREGGRERRRERGSESAGRKEGLRKKLMKVRKEGGREGGVCSRRFYSLTIHEEGREGRRVVGVTSLQR